MSMRAPSRSQARRQRALVVSLLLVAASGSVAAPFIYTRF